MASVLGTGNVRSPSNREIQIETRPPSQYLYTPLFALRLFELALTSQPKAKFRNPRPMSSSAAQEALIHIMVTASAADNKLKDIELSMIRNFCASLPVFEGFNIDTLDTISSRTVKLLGDGNGIDEILAIARDELPKRLHETAYALAVEIAAVDVSAGQEELQFLELLGDTLDIDKLGMAAIEHSARVRYRKM